MIEVVASCRDQVAGNRRLDPDLTLSGPLLSFNLILGCDLPVLDVSGRELHILDCLKADACLGSPSVGFHPLPSSKAKYLRHPASPAIPR